MAKVLKGKNPEDAITSKMIAKGEKMYGGAMTTKQWERTRKSNAGKTVKRPAEKKK